ncbi:vWA domain-containing protein [uncultured Croceitalea sp.]|uniref:vWA domain-containing protein n=1 Tax=uncultured Croceitalea sp. TaxID=1798908 RepID=UPI0033065DF3
MKKLNHAFAIGFFALSMSTTYGCKLKAEESKNEPLIAQAIVSEDDKPAKQYVKIALLLDTSNSMDGLINQAKAQLWDIVNEFTYARCGNEARPSLQIALYEYGNDDISSREGHIRQVIGFSSDLDEISEKLFSLTTNGGEEFCGQVINSSLKQLDWGKNEDDLKMIFIAGNEPFTQGKLNYVDATSQAKEKDVIVNTIFCGNYDQGVGSKWKNGAELTGGEYMAIDHNRQVVHVASPYDDVIIQLNSKLNKTYISYGYAGASKIAAQAEQDTNAYELNESVALKRAVSKSSRLYKNSSWDLVDAAEDSEFEVSELKKEDLPSELKDKTDKQIEKYIAEKKDERIKIQKEIQELNKKREAYIAKNQKEEKGELESALLTAIKNQAAKKNYKWDK